MSPAGARRSQCSGDLGSSPAGHSLLPQDERSPEGRELADAIEQAAFDPWKALAEHRPLGDVMRARKVVYFESQQGRA